MSYQPTDIEPKQLVDRYFAQWNESAADQRRRLIRQQGAAMSFPVDPPWSDS